MLHSQHPLLFLGMSAAQIVLPRALDADRSVHHAPSRYSQSSLPAYSIEAVTRSASAHATQTEHTRRPSDPNASSQTGLDVSPPTLDVVPPPAYESLDVTMSDAQPETPQPRADDAHERHEEDAHVDMPGRWPSDLNTNRSAPVHPRDAAPMTAGPVRGPAPLPSNRPRAARQVIPTAHAEPSTGHSLASLESNSTSTASTGMRGQLGSFPGDFARRQPPSRQPLFASLEPHLTRPRAMLRCTTCHNCQAAISLLEEQMRSGYRTPNARRPLTLVNQDMLSMMDALTTLFPCEDQAGPSLPSGRLNPAPQHSRCGAPSQSSHPLFGSSLERAPDSFEERSQPWSVPGAQMPEPNMLPPAPSPREQSRTTTRPAAQRQPVRPREVLNTHPTLHHHPLRAYQRALRSFEAPPRIRALSRTGSVLRRSGSLGASLKCPVCFEKPSDSELAIVDGCNHRFCRECLMQHVSISLEEGKVPISCPTCVSEKKSEPSGSSFLLSSINPKSTFTCSYLV